MFNQYIFMLIWIGFMSLIQRGHYREEYNELSGEYNWRLKPVFAFFVMLPIVWMAANRKWIGDTYLYEVIFKNDMPSSFSLIPGYIQAVSKDKGFYFVSAVIKVLFNGNTVTYWAIIALFQVAAIIYLYRRYSDDFLLCVFFFVASADCVSWMFNGIRQFVAVTIILFGTKWYLKREWIKAVAIVLIASLFHQSALIMLPFIFIAQGKALNWKTLLLIVGGIIATTSASAFLDLVDNVASYTQYNDISGNIALYSDDGTNPLRVLVYSIPALIAIYMRHKIEEHDGVINFCVNMSILSAVLYLVSMVSSGILIGRLPIYCSMYSYILLAWEVNQWSLESGNSMMRNITVGMYLVYYYFIMHFQFGLI